MRKTLRCFMIRVTIKFLRCTCLLEYSDEVKSLKVAINPQNLWVLIPEWGCTEVVGYLPAINLPVFINNLTVKNGVIDFAVINFE